MNKSAFHVRIASRYVNKYCIRIASSHARTASNTPARCVVFIIPIWEPEPERDWLAEGEIQGESSDSQSSHLTSMLHQLPMPIASSYHVVPKTPSSLGVSLLLKVKTVWGKIWWIGQPILRKETRGLNSTCYGSKHVLTYIPQHSFPVKFLSISGRDWNVM